PGLLHLDHEPDRAPLYGRIRPAATECRRFTAICAWVHLLGISAAHYAAPSFASVAGILFRGTSAAWWRDFLLGGGVGPGVYPGCVHRRVHAARLCSLYAG